MPLRYIYPSPPLYSSHYHHISSLGLSRKIGMADSSIIDHQFTRQLGDAFRLYDYSCFETVLSLAMTFV